MHRRKKARLIALALIVTVYLVIGLGVGYFYRYFTVRDFQDVNEKVLDVTGAHTLALPPGFPYMLKLWGDAAPRDVFVNGERIVHSFFRQRKTIAEIYYFIPEALITENNTRIRIEPPMRLSMRVRNSVAASEWGSIILLGSRTQPGTSPVPLLLFSGFGGALVPLWMVLCRRFPHLKRTDVAATCFWSCCVVLFNFWFLKTLGRLFKVAFLFHPSSWTLCVLFTFGAVYALRSLARLLVQLRREHAHKSPGGAFVSGVEGVDTVLHYIELLLQAFKKTRSRQFAEGAVVCLVFSTLTLAFGLRLWANLMSILVFGCLVLGAIRRLDEVRGP